VQETYNHRSTDAALSREGERLFAQSISPLLRSAIGWPSEDLQSAVADFLFALRNAYRHRPDEARRYILRTAAVLRTKPAGETTGCATIGTYLSAKSPHRGGLAPWKMRRVSSYIETHLDSTIRTTDLASLIKLSVFHFSRAFRASFGEAPHTFLMRRRIERAQDMMLQTNLPLAQVAINCGMSDQAHLNRSFRRFIGQSPGAWRRARTAPPQ
jgi:AraC family transcriptional regulator